MLGELDKLNPDIIIVEAGLGMSNTCSGGNVSPGFLEYYIEFPDEAKKRDIDNLAVNNWAKTKGIEVLLADLPLDEAKKIAGKNKFSTESSCSECIKKIYNAREKVIADETIKQLKCKGKENVAIFVGEQHGLNIMKLLGVDNDILIKSEDLVNNFK